MSIKKKILLTIAFVVVTLIVPAVLLLLFVDALTSFAAYVVTFGVILFAILGFIVISSIDVQTTLKKTVEELKMQNAAIAYKLSNNTDIVPVDVNTDTNEKTEVSTASNDTPKDTSKINLNPADPLVMPIVKQQAPVVEKKTDDGFDDFQ